MDRKIEIRATDKVSLMAIAVNIQSMAYSDMIQTPMEDEELKLWVELLRNRIGLRDSILRKSFLAQCLNIRMQKCGLVSRPAYLSLLRADNTLGREEWDYFIDLLPLHETRFFRHESSLKLLNAYLAGYLQGAPSRPTTLTAWSVGCATGEEPYSLAIVIDQAMRHLSARVGFHVVGSDLSHSSLNTARRGVYHKRQLSNVSPEYMELYFNKINNDHFEVRAELREKIKLVPVNLRELQKGAALVGVVNIVFCQNVLIYFEGAERERIVNCLVDQLLPGGLLVLGAGEVLRWTHPQMKRIASDEALAYQKIQTSG